MNYLQMLSDKINSYKSYNQAVKTRVLKQLENRTELTEQQYKTVIKNVSKVMKANKLFLTKYNNEYKKVLGVSVHRYAPELNTLQYLNGTTVKVPQQTTVEDAIKYLINNGKI